MNKPKHPEYKDLKKWVKSKLVTVDNKYDPEKFYIDRTNFVLLNLDVYIEDWEYEGNQ